MVSIEGIVCKKEKALAVFSFERKVMELTGPKEDRG
jgi:hypothetical protein